MSIWHQAVCAANDAGGKVPPDLRPVNLANRTVARDGDGAERSNIALSRQPLLHQRSSRQEDLAMAHRAPFSIAERRRSTPLNDAATARGSVNCDFADCVHPEARPLQTADDKSGHSLGRETNRSRQLMEAPMRKSPLIPLFTLLAGVSTLSLAANQSLHFPVNAPSTGDNLGVGLKAAGFNPINSGPVNVTSGDAGGVVASKAAKAVCLASFNSGVSCTVNKATIPTPTVCSTDGSCCDLFIASAFPVTLGCTVEPGGIGKGFSFSLPGGDSVQASAFNGGTVSHLGADNKNIYPDVRTDIAPRALIQLRPNGISGTVQIKIYHTQAGANPRIANVTVDASNSGAANSLALHNAVRTALQSISPALSPAIVATVHTLDDAVYPLTAFGYFKQATNFVEITNITNVGITDVEVIVPAGQGFSTEGTENVVDAGDVTVPTLSGWGAIFAAAILLTMIFLLHRKRMRMQQV
jgi:hypothetical protein